MSPCSIVQLVARGRCVRVPGRVGRAHLEGVTADREAAVAGRRGAGRERGAVERAFEASSRLRRPRRRSSRRCSVVVASGPESIVVSGAVTSVTVQVCIAGVGSTLPAPSVAATSKVWAPAASDETVTGERHSSAAKSRTPSSKQVKVTPASFEEKAEGRIRVRRGRRRAADDRRLRRRRLDRPAELLRRVGLTPSAFVATTSNRCSPSARPV